MILPPFAKLGMSCTAEHRDKIFDAGGGEGLGKGRRLFCAIVEFY
jgi:hypothetical protein